MNSSVCINPTRYLTLAHLHFKNHYDALGVTPKATQADIKSAYYKLSLIHHPDRNQGCKESAAKFQKIQNAYEVLGDHKARRLYDKGVFVNPSSSMGDMPGKGANPVVQKSRPVSTVRTPIYDYDEWSKAHYGESFSRRTSAKSQFESNRRFREKADQHYKTRNIGVSFVIMLIGAILISVAYEDMDEPVSKYKK